MATPGQVQVQLCGRLEVRVGGRDVTPELPGRQGRLLFAFLVLERGRPVSREAMIAALWPTAPPPTADGSLSALLSRLRKALGPDALHGRSELTLDLGADATVDLTEAGDALARARSALAGGDDAAAAAAAQYAVDVAERGLLPGVEAPFLDGPRRDVDVLLAEALEAAAAAGLAAGIGRPELAAAETAARRLTLLDPFRESAWALLMRIQAARGNATQAQHSFQELRALLRDELGTVPTAELLRLHDELLRGEAAPAAVEPPRTAPARSAPPLHEGAAPTSFVGRTEALAALTAELDATARGERRVAMLAGEPGIGKTTLAARWASDAEQAGATVLTGRCAQDALRPHGPWAEALARVAPTLPGAVSDGLAPLLGPSTGPDAADAGAFARHRLYDAVVDAFDVLGTSGPVVLVLDDLHWADPSTLALLRHLAAAGAGGPLLVVGTYRDTEVARGHPLADAIATLRRALPVRRLELDGLAGDELAELVQGGGVTLGGDTVARIGRDTGGNPFFVGQVVRQLADGDDGAVPEAARDVVEQRIGQLEPAVGALLERASIMGDDFDARVLERVAQLGEDEVLDALEQARAAGLLAETATAPGRFAFVHALVRTALYEGQGTARRMSLHRRVGEALERGDGDRRALDLPALAHHFLAAGPSEADRAVVYALRAAEEARRRLAHDDAVVLIERALAARAAEETADDEERARLEILLSDALCDASREGEGRAAAARAVAASERAGVAALIARAALEFARPAVERYGVVDSDVDAVLEAAIRATDGHDAEQAELQARLAEMRYFAGGPRAARPLADAAMAAARRADERAPLLAAMNARQHGLWTPLRAAERLAAADEQVALATADDRPEPLLAALVWRISGLLMLDRVAEAQADIAHAVRVAEALARPTPMLYASILRGLDATIDEDWERLAAVLAAREALGPRASQYDGKISTATQLLGLHGEQGRIADLAGMLRSYSDAFPDTAGWRAALAWSLAASGDGEAARRELDVLEAADYVAYPEDGNVLVPLTYAARAAIALGEQPRMDAIHARLEPFSSLSVVIGPWVTSLGAVRRTLDALERQAA